MKTFLLLCSLALAVSGEVGFDAAAQNGNEKKYLVFPGLYVGVDEIAKWSTGFASPFNVLFGAQPYVLEWIGSNNHQITDYGNANEYTGSDHMGIAKKVIMVRRR